jgi:hypothetical protein
VVHARWEGQSGRERWYQTDNNEVCEAQTTANEVRVVRAQRGMTMRWMSCRGTRLRQGQGGRWHVKSGWRGCNGEARELGMTVQPRRTMMRLGRCAQ